MSEIVQAHLPCPDCGSHDALTLYDDGHTYCFSCETYHKDQSEDTHEDTSHKKSHDSLIDRDDMEIKALRSRCITAETCRKYGYYVTKHNNKTIQVAEYCDDDGRPLFQKTRDKDKNFLCLGKTVQRFWGQHLFTRGKKLVVTEGEIDCLSVSQMNGNKYPVVSLPFGATSAEKVFKANLKWLGLFDEVVVMFDMDEAGQKAVKKVQGLLPPHKLKIARLPMKDANECLKAGKGDEIINAIFDAKEYRPDSIVNAADMAEAFFAEDNIKGYDWPWDKKVNKMTLGIRKGEMLMLTAGTGIGKSTAAREIAYKLKTQDGLTIGMVMLEENVKKTLRDLLSLEVNKPLSILWNSIDKTELAEPYQKLFGDGKFYLYDHFGSLESNTLLDSIRYLIVGCGCDFVVLDHISIAVSGLEEAGNDERKTIDRLMTQLRSLVEETGAGLIVVSHLKKPSGDNSFEEGAAISLDDLRGSGILKQLPDTIIALERNQQSEDEYEKNKIKIRVLKCRFTGNTGLAGSLFFNKKTYRLRSEEDEQQF